MLGGAFLRALDALGVAERCVELGVGLNTTTLYTADGEVLADIPLPRVARADLPLAAGITRNNLLAVLRDAAETGGAVVRYGTTVEDIDNGPEAVRATRPATSRFPMSCSTCSARRQGRLLGPATRRYRDLGGLSVLLGSDRGASSHAGRSMLSDQRHIGW
jgi:hypothetical protein